MPLTAFPALIAGQSPASSLNISPLATTGKIFFVDSNRGKDDNVGDDSLRPKASTMAAIIRCRPNRGDQIWLMPGHAETVSVVNGITMNIAGVSIFGMGRGANRPQFTFGSPTVGDPNASITFSAPNCAMFNVIGLAGMASLAQPFNVQPGADDCALALEWQDQSPTQDAIVAVNAVGVARFSAVVHYLGFAGAVDTVAAITLNGVNHASLDLDTYGFARNAWVQMVQAPSVDVRVTGKMYTVQSTSGAQTVEIIDSSHNVNDYTNRSTWNATIEDRGAAVTFLGGYLNPFAPAFFTAASLNTLLAGILAPIAATRAAMDQLFVDMEQLRIGDMVSFAPPADPQSGLLPTQQN